MLDPTRAGANIKGAWLPSLGSDRVIGLFSELATQILVAEHEMPNYGTVPILFHRIRANE